MSSLKFILVGIFFSLTVQRSDDVNQRADTGLCLEVSIPVRWSWATICLFLFVFCFFPSLYSCPHYFRFIVKSVYLVYLLLVYLLFHSADLSPLSFLFSSTLLASNQVSVADFTSELHHTLTPSGFLIVGLLFQFVVIVVGVHRGFRFPAFALRLFLLQLMKFIYPPCVCILVLVSTSTCWPGRWLLTSIVWPNCSCTNMTRIKKIKNLKHQKESWKTEFNLRWSMFKRLFGAGERARPPDLV